MRDQDKAALHEILGRGDGFGHRQHVELAWRYLAQHDTPAEASDAMAEAIRAVAVAHGQDAKYHETITRAWATCVAVHAQRWPAGTFPEFIERNPQLLDPGLLACFYSPSRLQSPEARQAWLTPDRRPLPALAGQ
jgi:hypothetical protein